MSLFEAIVVLIVVLAVAVGVYSLLFGRDRRQQAVEDEYDRVMEKQLDPESHRRDSEN
jgi:flagellar basal body-associated protein FliL